VSEEGGLVQSVPYYLSTSILALGYQAATGGQTVQERMASETATGIMNKKGTDMLQKALETQEDGVNLLATACWQEHGACSALVDKYIPLGKGTSGWHDLFTGTMGLGERSARVELLQDFIDIPVIGAAYNFGTMVPAWGMTVGSWLGQTGLAAPAYSGIQVNY
jgi:hypothetical protein